MNVTAPEPIAIVEVSPRDGLQNESTLIGTADKIALVARAIEFGAQRVEVASFVNPRRVPQMADAEAVIAGLHDDHRLRYTALCLNVRGVERAIAARDAASMKRAASSWQATASESPIRARALPKDWSPTAR